MELETLETSAGGAWYPSSPHNALLLGGAKGPSKLCAQLLRVFGGVLPRGFVGAGVLMGARASLGFPTVYAAGWLSRAVSGSGGGSGCGAVGRRAAS